MKKLFLSGGVWLLVSGSFAQTVTQNLQKAFKAFETDPQLKYAISSLYVVDANSGNVVFDKNSQVGLAPASTQKIITAATAFELLGKDYRYKTRFISGKDLHTNSVYWLFVDPSGDPTFGSQRYDLTKGEMIFNSLNERLKNRQIEMIWIVENKFDTKAIPDGWIWQDIGNYYGTSSAFLNWKENQYDIFFDSNQEAEPTIITKITMDTIGKKFVNEVKAGKPGSGDNAYIYNAPYSNTFIVQGTIPPGKNSFSISGSVSDPASLFASELKGYLIEKSSGPLKKNNVGYHVYRSGFRSPYKILGMPTFGVIDTLYTHYSPSLDSIIYWFLQKSINLYGEALVKTFAYEKNGFGSTDGGVKIIKDFWKEKGIDENELNIGDGSGLSPGNRVTTHAQVEILKYAKKRPWFSYFYDALPEYNGMKMKSGTIKNVKAYCGYHKAANGKEYIFSFLVNNYNGSSSELIGKMYRVLNHLK